MPGGAGVTARWPVGGQGLQGRLWVQPEQPGHRLGQPECPL